MRSSLVATALLTCLAATACGKDEPKKEATPPASSAPSAAPASAAPPAAADSSKPEPKEHAEHAKHARKPRAITVAFGQHPPKPEKEAAPSIPELPSLDKQEKSTPPAKLPAGEYACGASHSGDHDVPLMCLEDKNHEKDPKAVHLLLPYGHFKGKLPVLPRVVDHRLEETEASVRDQGSAGTCTTFGTSAAIDHAITRWTGTPSHVSTMELWGRYHQPDLGEALVSTVGQTFAAEEAWPYDPKVAWPWRSCPSHGAKGDGPCGKHVDEAKLKELEKKPEVIVEQVEWLPKDFEVVRRKIAAGNDPVFAMKLPRHFIAVGKTGSMYVPDYKDEAGGHAIALAGYALGEKGDNYYLIHNSWGEKWGDKGYAWIHEATLAKVCPKGEAPDSHTGACSKECKEGGPMHNGVCPEASDCPAGFVNLWGECIGAAPTDSGKDEKEGISWKCGPGGCAYELSKAVGKCSSEPCMLSCPAPSFRVGKDEHGLTCVE